MPVVVVFSTFPSADKAAEVARVLVEERLVACVNVIGGVRSIFRWEGKICDDAEVLAVVKTTNERADAVMARLTELHPYQVPEMLVLPVTAGSAPYLAWVAGEVG